jgi:carnitine 3-dehydrogenase
MTQPTAVKRAAILGAGTIGASWTAWFMSRGMEVQVWDPRPKAADYVRRYVADAWPAMARLGMAEAASPDTWRFCATTEDAVADVDFVQENAPERMPVKRELYGRIDAVLRADAVLASSTSGLIMSDMQAGFRSAARFAVGHPFNPPHLIPLVEVVGGTTASPEAVAAAVAFYRAIGKHPITLMKEVPGHLANRLQAALWREAVHMVAEGVATVADVDAAISEGPGLRWALMGPHTTFHLAGGEGGYTQFMHHLMPAVTSWWESLGDPVMTPALQQALIAGVAEATGGRSIPDLAAERDAALTRLLAARADRGRA